MGPQLLTALQPDDGDPAPSVGRPRRDTQSHVERALALMLWCCVISSQSHTHSEPQSLHLAMPAAVVNSQGYLQSSCDTAMQMPKWMCLQCLERGHDRALPADFWDLREVPYLLSLADAIFPHSDASCPHCLLGRVRPYRPSTGHPSALCRAPNVGSPSGVQVSVQTCLLPWQRGLHDAFLPGRVQGREGPLEEPAHHLREDSREWQEGD